MPTASLTDRSVARARPPTRGRLDLWDAEMPGFGLRISPAGRRSWQLMYRFEGRKRRLTLGTFPSLPLEIARDAARATLKEVAKGNDPAAARAAARGSELSFEGFAQAYIERYAKRRKRSWRADASMIARHLLPAWRRRAAAGIGRRDVIEVVEAIAARGHPYAANRCLSLLRTMFAWGVEADLVRATPVVRIAAPGHEVRRRRVLADDEVAALWGAWNAMAWPFGPLFKIVLLTAQRRSQVAGMRLTDIGFANQLWTVPHSSGVPGHAHAIPLSSHVLEIITSLPRTGSGYVFPARGRPGRHVSGFSKAARRATRLSGVADWRCEDLRRTAAAGMLSLGTPAPVIRQLLDSVALPTVAGVEAGPALGGIDDLRNAFQAWGEHVRALDGNP